MGLPAVDINYLAVLVAGIVSFVIGGLWYSPILFGNVWVKLSKFTKKDMEAAQKKGMTKLYIIQFIVSLLMACILAHFAAYLTAETFIDSLQLAIWSWLGFIVPVQIGSVLWECRPVKLFLINTSHYLVALIIMAAIIVAW